MKSKSIMSSITSPLHTIVIASALMLAMPSIALATDNQKHDDHDHSKRDHSEKDHDKHEHGKHDHGEHDHGDGHHESHHGGIVGTADGLHHELVLTEAGKIIFYAEGLPEGDALKAVIVRLTILQGKEKQSLEMTLSKDDAHRFEVPISQPLKVGDKVVALINVDAKKMRMVRFEVAEEPKN